MVQSHPFEALSKYMSSTHQARDGSFYLTVKGAPDVIFARCSQMLCDGQVREMQAQDRQHLDEQANNYANQGLRVLALAYRVPQQQIARHRSWFLSGWWRWLIRPAVRCRQQ